MATQSNSSGGGDDGVVVDDDDEDDEKIVLRLRWRRRILIKTTSLTLIDWVVESKAKLVAVATACRESDNEENIIVRILLLWLIH